MAGTLLAVVAGALALAPVGAVAAKPNLTLTVQLVPGTLTPGQNALAIVELANTGTDTLTDVKVTLRLPSSISAFGAPGCTPVGGSGAVVTCPFGKVAKGATAQAFVVTRVARRVQREQHLKVVFLLRVGPGNPAPIVSTSAAVVLASVSTRASEGSCLKVPKTLSATLHRQTTELPSPPVADPALRLPCTPLAVGVLPKPRSGGFRTGVSTVDLPKLTRPATVVLRFPDENLPDENLIHNLPPGAVPRFDNPDPLWVIDPAHAKRIVPLCKGGPRLPVGWQSCVARVLANDPDSDGDAGTITLLVRGAGFGDPKYVG